MKHSLPALFPALLGLAAVSAPGLAQQPTAQVSFEQDVRPILARRCVACHGVQNRGNLKLRTFQELMTGGMRGPAVVPGDPERSLLIRLVTGQQAPRMPAQGEPLSPNEIKTLTEWVRQGARPAPLQAQAPPAAPAQPAAPAAPVSRLEVLSPKPGAEVRERVAVVVPRDSVPADGFISIFIDGYFKAAVAPRDVEALDDEGLPADSPIRWVWDTRDVLHTDRRKADANQPPAEGMHTIDVVVFSAGGTEIDRQTIPVTLKNSIEFDANRPVPLYYGGRVGASYELEHVVDLEATQITESGVRGAPSAPSARRPPPAGAVKLTHNETTTTLISLEDMSPRSGLMFWRERRESPMTLLVNGSKSVVNFDGSSVYYGMSRRGIATVSKAMERLKREPLANPVVLPGRVHPFGQPFNTSIQVNLGAYIPATLEIPNIEAKIEGVEWLSGEPCARIKATYLAGTGLVDVNTLSIRGGKLDIQDGVSTIWFSLASKRVLRALHEIKGTVVVENMSDLSGGAGAMGYGGMSGMGMDGADGGMMGYGGGAGPGMMGSGGPGGMMGYGGGAGPGMMGSGGPGGMMGYGGGAGPGMMGSGGPGMMGSGGPGMMGSGYGSPFGGADASGSMGFGDPSGMGGGTGISRPTRFSVKLKVETRLPRPKAI